MRMNARLLSTLALVVLLPGACLLSQTTSTFQILGSPRRFTRNVAERNQSSVRRRR
jgi:hypothetical protein